MLMTKMNSTATMMSTIHIVDPLSRAGFGTLKTWDTIRRGRCFCKAAIAGVAAHRRPGMGPSQCAPRLMDEPEALDCAGELRRKPCEPPHYAPLFRAQGRGCSEDPHRPVKEPRPWPRPRWIRGSAADQIMPQPGWPGLSNSAAGVQAPC